MVQVTNELAVAINRAEQKRDVLDRTPTLELVSEIDNCIIKKIEYIIEKYQNHLSATKLKKEEMDTVKKYVNMLTDSINQDMTMCKVIPQCRIKYIVNLNSPLGGFFARKADIDILLKDGTDYYKNLYKGLRLDYNNSEFNENDEYMGMLIVRLPQFSLRAPISSRVEVDKEAEGRLIRIDNEEPYSGIGFIANKLCIPEFYISINNKEPWSKFPIEAFSAKLKIIGRNANIIDFANYDAGDYECAPDEKFVIDKNYMNLAIRNGWI